MKHAITDRYQQTTLSRRSRDIIQSSSTDIMSRSWIPYHAQLDTPVQRKTWSHHTILLSPPTNNKEPLRQKLEDIDEERI